MDYLFAVNNPNYSGTKLLCCVHVEVVLNVVLVNLLERNPYDVVLVNAFNLLALSQLDCCLSSAAALTYRGLIYGSVQLAVSDGLASNLSCVNADDRNVDLLVGSLVSLDAAQSLTTL